MKTDSVSIPPAVGAGAPDFPADGSRKRTWSLQAAATAEAMRLRGGAGDSDSESETEWDWDAQTDTVTTTASTNEIFGEVNYNLRSKRQRLEPGIGDAAQPPRTAAVPQLEFGRPLKPPQSMDSRGAATPTWSRRAEVLDKIKSGVLPVGQEITRQMASMLLPNAMREHNTAAWLKGKQIVDVLKRDGVLDDGGRVRNGAAQLIERHPELNWLAENHEKLKRADATDDKNAPLTRVDFAALTYVANSELNETLHGAAFRHYAAGDEQVELTVGVTRKAFQWLHAIGAIEGPGEQKGVVTDASRQVARTALADFNSEINHAADQAEGLNRSARFSGAGHYTATDVNRSNRQDNAARQAKTLQEIRDGGIAPGTVLEISSGAARRQGITRDQLQSDIKSLYNNGLADKLNNKEYRVRADAAATINADPDMSWRANNNNRLGDHANSLLPGNRASQFVLELLRNHDDQGGDVFSGVRTLKDASGMTKRQISTALSWLESNNMLQKDGPNTRRVVAGAPTHAQNALTEFQLLDPTSQLQPVSEDQQAEAADYQQPQGATDFGKKRALLAHLLTKVANGDLGPGDNFPTTAMDLAQAGLPSLGFAGPDLRSTLDLLTERQADNSYQLKPNVQQLLAGNADLNWLAQNSENLGRPHSTITPLNRQQHLMLTLLAGEGGAPNSVIPSRNKLQTQFGGSSTNIINLPPWLEENGLTQPGREQGQSLNVAGDAQQRAQSALDVFEGRVAIAPAAN